MNIDLLFTAQGEAGLVSSENLVKKAVGLLFDVNSGILTLEYADMDHLDLNIPVDRDFFAGLDQCPQIHVGAVKGGNIAQAYQIPLMFLDDPYRGEAFKHVKQPKNPLAAFENFITRCVRGQPVHRDDLGNEATVGCVLGAASPAALQFAPHLARRHAMEISPKAAPGAAPRFGGPGLGSSSGGGGGIIRRAGSDTIPDDD